MNNYLTTLNATQKSNINKIVSVAKARGIQNPVSIAGMLSVISKESEFIPKEEKGYSGTSVARIRQVFSSTFKNFNDQFIEDLKKDDKAFFDFIYGGRFGNKPDEGYLYRGRGLNQVTFKNNYFRAFKQTGIDVVSDPDKLLEIETAAIVCVEFFKAEFANSVSKIQSRYGASDINDFSSLSMAAQAFYNANAGFSKDTRNSTNDGYKKALDRVDELYSLIHF